MKREDIKINDTFERWTVIGLPSKNNGRWCCLCECNCSLKTIKLIPCDNLISKKSKSCGCLHKEILNQKCLAKLSEKQEKVKSKAQYGEILLEYQPNGQSKFHDPEHGDFYCNYHHFVRGLAKHPIRTKGKVTLEEAKKRLEASDLPIKIIEYGGSITSESKFEDVDFGEFDGQLNYVLTGHRSHPDRASLNRSLVNKALWQNHEYVTKVKTGLAKAKESKIEQIEEDENHI